MSLTELKALVAEGHRPNYYTELLKNYKSIIEAVAETTQAKVAKDLGMSEPKFSAIYNLLLAYKELNNANS